MKLMEENRTNKIDKADHTRVTFFQARDKRIHHPGPPHSHCLSAGLNASC